MNESNSPTIRSWVFAIGATGFAAGFFGPMWLNPDANQGPMLGIFISGPLGLLSGLALGLIFKWLPISGAAKRTTMLVVCVMSGGTVLYFCLPEPKVRGYVIDGTIASCAQPSERINAAINHWDERIAQVTWAPPRSGWKQDVDRMLNESGTVVTVQATRTTELLEGRKPWNRGMLSIKEWRGSSESKAYFARYAGDDCASYVGTTNILFVATGQGSSAWPPTDLSNFLELALIEPLPVRYQSLLK